MSALSTVAGAWSTRQSSDAGGGRRATGLHREEPRTRDASKGVEEQRRRGGAVKLTVEVVAGESDITGRVRPASQTKIPARCPDKDPRPHRWFDWTA
jgi:hypothetical protein